LFDLHYDGSEDDGYDEYDGDDNDSDCDENFL